MTERDKEVMLSKKAGRFRRRRNLVVLNGGVTQSRCMWGFVEGRGCCGLQSSGRKERVRWQNGILRIVFRLGGESLVNGEAECDESFQWCAACGWRGKRVPGEERRRLVTSEPKAWLARTSGSEGRGSSGPCEDSGSNRRRGNIGTQIKGQKGDSNGGELGRNTIPRN